MGLSIGLRCEHWVAPRCSLLGRRYDFRCILTASVGVLNNSAPNASRTTCFSRDIFSGMVMMILYPRTAPASANPIPVLPLVEKISPRLIRPCFSASITMLYAMRSFIDPPGLKNHISHRGCMLNGSRLGLVSPSECCRLYPVLIHTT